MANQTVTTPVNHDSDSVSGLLNGEQYSINGGELTINADVRWNQNNAVLGAITISTTLGGKLIIDGRDIWEIPFTASSGTVPTQLSLGSNTVTGGASGATGELTRVWATGEIYPRTSGAMPAAGYIKLRTKTGTFIPGETITLPGGATITASNAGKRSWIHVVGQRQGSITIPRLGSLEALGDWYELGETDGTDNQFVPIPFIDEVPAVQIETAPGSGVYRWWLSAGQRWQDGHTSALSFISTDSRGRYFGQVLRRTDAATTTGSNIITVADTTGLVVGSPIVFSAGFSDSDDLYISQIDSSTQFRVSTNSNATGTGRTIITFRAGITLAHRGTYSCGEKPPSGCKIRIPNVIFSTTTAGPADSNLRRGQISEGVGGDRWDLTTTAAGAITLHTIMDCAYICATSSAYSVQITNAASFAQAHANTATAPSLVNCAVGLSRINNLVAISLSSQFTGVTLENCISTRYSDGSNTYGAQLTDCANVSVQDCEFRIFPSTSANTHSNAGTRAFNLSRCFDVIIDGCRLVGAGLQLIQVTRATVTDVQYADGMAITTTSTNGMPAIDVTNTSSSITIDGFSALDDLPNVHPYNQILLTSTSAASVEFRNLGTPAAPYNMGSANACGTIVSASVTLGLTMRRLYAQNTRTAALSLSNTVQNVICDNVWGDGNDSQAIPALNIVCRGCQWTYSTTGQNSVYGRHWEDAFTGDTTGNLVIACNEPLPATVSQCETSFSVGSGFTSGGQVSMATVGDSVTWTMPYAMLGHTSFVPNTNVSPFVITATSQSSHKFEYQINTGSGFSSWKRLVSVIVRNSGGSTGTNTFVMNSKPEDMPQIGDLISSTTAGRLPAGTTITNIVGTTITVSNNFLAALGTTEVLHTWRDIADEPAINPVTGVALKVRASVITAGATNALTYIKIDTATDATNKQTQYPLPVLLPKLTITGFESGSDVVIYDADVEPSGDGSNVIETFNEVVGTSVEYIYTFTPGVNILIGVFKPGKVPLILGPILLLSTDSSLPVSQREDRAYVA